MNELNHAKWMQHAFEHSLFSVGISRPNPAVGAVIVKDGNVVGMGRTEKPGGAHAEVVALRQAGELARGADLYVTLEPCCHFGRTPPCTAAILNAGIRNVFFAHADPNPKVFGKSKSILETAGVSVKEGLAACGGDSRLFQEIEHFFEAYDFFVRTGLPFTEVKSAVTQDYKIAHADKLPLAITSPKANEQNHKWRAMSDAILIGARTALIDNPLLNVRLVKGNSPIKIIWAHSTELPNDLQLFKTETPETIFVFSKVEQKQIKMLSSVQVFPLAGESFEVDWNEMLKVLASLGMHRLFVEPGQTLAALLYRFKLWNRWNVWQSNQIFGDGLELKTLPSKAHETFRLQNETLFVYKNSLK